MVNVDSTRVRTGTDTLRLVTFNIEFAVRIDSAIAVLTSEPAVRGADVIMVQEMDADGTKRLAESLGLSYVYYPAIYHLRTKRDFGNAVLSRWPIVDDGKLTLPRVSRYAGTHRIATAATLRIGDALVRVYSTHLGTLADIGAAARAEQLRAIIDDAAPYRRVVIGGDMNAHAVGAVARQLGYSWPTERGPHTTRLGRWDHIFLKGLASPDSGGAGTVLDVRDASDHRPVWALAILR
jgi:endonuclease/exonuclease/phosphatase family metal-dependent hydrolase